MQIRAGYEISYACAQPTPMIAMLSVHPSRKTALITPDLMGTDPAVPAKEYVDGFGNICHVIHAPVGHITLSSDFLVHDGGSADEVAPQAEQHPMENLPVDTLVYLLGSRYCETDHFVQFAWSKFGNHPKGWPLVQAICSYVHEHLRLRACESDENRLASAQRAAGCMP
jgi:transglutaminase-like putative cysteine protease